MSVVWIYSIGRWYFDRVILVPRLFGWTLLNVFMQSLGAGLRRYRPTIARAVLTWFTRPLLLLSGILLITLGVYINHYVFHHTDRPLILSLLSLITVGFFVGWCVGLAVGLRQPGAKALATELAVFNGLLATPALRNALHAPEGDLVSMVPLWATLLTPIPMVYHAVARVGLEWLQAQIDRLRGQTGVKSGVDPTVAQIGINGENGNSPFPSTGLAVAAAAAIALGPAVTTESGDNHRRKRRDHSRDERTSSREASQAGTSPSEGRPKEYDIHHESFPTEMQRQENEPNSTNTTQSALARGLPPSISGLLLEETWQAGEKPKSMTENLNQTCKNQILSR
ncbi:unnamed protein product, partial [Protopolystoma xenopodis]